MFNDGNALASVSGANANTNAWLDALGRYKFDGGYLADGVTVPAPVCDALTVLAGVAQGAAFLECGDNQRAAPLFGDRFKSGVARDTACRTHSKTALKVRTFSRQISADTAAELQRFACPGHL